MFDSGRAPERPPVKRDSDRQRFLRCVAAVTSSRQVSMSELNDHRPPVSHSR